LGRKGPSGHGRRLGIAEKPTPKMGKRKKNVAAASPPHPRSHASASFTGLTVGCRHPQLAMLPTLRILSCSAVASCVFVGRSRLATSSPILFSQVVPIERKKIEEKKR
jgi:hypothetical protein